MIITLAILLNGSGIPISPNAQSKTQTINPITTKDE